MLDHDGASLFCGLGSRWKRTVARTKDILDQTILNDASETLR